MPASLWKEPPCGKKLENREIEPAAKLIALLNKHSAREQRSR